MRGENVIIFSSDDWSSGLKTSKYHIARQLARHNRVLFVNSIGLRSPAAASGEAKRALGKLRAFFRGPVWVLEGLHVYTPIVFPFFRASRLVTALNGFLLRTIMSWLQRRLALSNPIVFVFIPTFNEVIGRLGEKAIVYYCIDDLRGYDGIDITWFDQQEERLLSRANCVIACSKKLQVAFQERGYRAYYVPHGVDWALFRKAVEEDMPLPEDLRDVPEPRLGFYGFLSDEVVDFALLLRMAAERPEWHIVLIGKPKAGMDMDSLTRAPNIHYLGLKPFHDLPAYTRHFAVGLMPFRIMQVTWNSNPLKMWEYLAGGLPVVSSDIPEVRHYADAVHIARTHEEFIEKCNLALNEGSREARDRRSRAVECDSWERRIERISEIVRQEMVTSTAGP